MIYIYIIFLIVLYKENYFTDYECTEQCKCLHKSEKQEYYQCSNIDLMKA